MNYTIFKRRLTALLLCLAVCLSLFPAALALADSKLIISVTGTSYDAGKLTAAIQVSNSGSEPAEGELRAALKNEAGSKLLAPLMTQTVSVTDGGVVTVMAEISIASLPEAYTLEVYLWDTQGNLRPATAKQVFRPGAETESTEGYELKDIEAVKVYQLVEGEAVYRDALDPATITDYSDYMVEILMRDMPTTYSGIAGAVKEGATAVLSLSRTDLVTYDETTLEAKPARLEYPCDPRADFADILTTLQANPNAVISLDKDYDASQTSIVNGNTLTGDIAFKGTINGNGHTIYNLPATIFQSMEGATVENLVIRDAVITPPSNRTNGAVLARTAKNTTITNVHVAGLLIYKSANANNLKYGGLVGTLSGASTVQECSVTDFMIRGNANNANNAGFLGGLVGQLQGTSVIRNCLTQGVFNYIGKSNSANTRIGGIVGSLEGENQVTGCVAEVENLCAATSAMGGLVGWVTQPTKCTIENCFAAGSTAAGHKFLGVEKSASGAELTFISNSYELEEAEGIGNAPTEKRTVIEVEYQKDAEGNSVPVEVEVEKDFPIHGGPVDFISRMKRFSGSFYRDTLKLDPDIWFMEYVSFSGLPYPGSAFPKDTVEQPKGQGIYLPNSALLIRLPGYDPAHQTAYSNVYRLMPYLNSQALIEAGNALASQGGVLAEQAVRYVLPLMSNQYQPAITNENYREIDGLMVLFADGSRTKYTLTAPSLAGGVAQYTVEEAAVPYAYRSYVVDVTAPAVGDLIARLSALTYGAQPEPSAQTDLVALVGGRDINTNTYGWAASEANSAKLGGRSDWSSANDQNKLDDVFDQLHQYPEQFAYALLASDGGLYASSDHPAVRAKLSAELSGENLSRLVYAYLYLQRWYDIDLESHGDGDVNLADVMYFSSELYGGQAGVDHIAAAVVDAPRTARRSNGTISMYTSRFTSIYSNENLPGFLSENIALFTDSPNMSQWFRDFYKGPLEERPITAPDGRSTRSAWASLVAREPGWILPLLTLENDPVEGKDVYMVVAANNFHIGCMSTYAKDYTNPAEYAQVAKMVTAYADRWDDMFSVSALFVDNGYDTLVSTLYESRDSAYMAKYTGKMPSGTPARIPACDGAASPGMRKFFAAVGILQAQSTGASAWANGWLMNNERGLALDMNSMGVQTHENAHNTASRYFYGNHPNRMGPEGETNGVLAQFHRGLYIMNYSLNLMETYPVTSEYVGGLDVERVRGMNQDGSMTQIHDFYRKYFEAMYTLDLLEARAVLSLDKEEQRALLFQHSYPNWTDGEPQTATSKKDSVWAPVATQEAYDALQIQDYTDLIDNHLNITRDVKRDTTYVGTGAYNFSSPFSACLWSPYNDMGRADQVTAKKLPYELLGESGWQYGFANYLSKTPENGGNDLGALRVAMAHTDLLTEPAVQGGGYNLDPATMTYEDWKLARYKVEETKLDTITSPYFDTETVYQAYRAAFLADANYYGTRSGAPFPVEHLTEVKPYSSAIRMNMLRYLLRITNNFAVSIYEPDADLVEVSTAQELIDAVTANPLANIQMAADLDFSSVTPVSGAEAYITAKNFLGRVNGKREDGSCYSMKNLKLPLFQNIMYGHVENIIFDGVDISGLPDYTGTVARKADKGYFGNVHIVNAALSGANVGGIVGQDQDPKLVANDAAEGVNLGGSTFVGASVNASITGTGSIGGLTAYGLGSVVASSYATGTVNGTGNGRRGGLMGDSQGSAIVGSYAAMDWKTAGAGLMAYCQDARGFIHLRDISMAWHFPTVVNSLAVNLATASGKTANKFTGVGNDMRQYGFANNYEYADSPGVKNADGTYIFDASYSDLTDPAFYVDVLGFSENMWDFSGVAGGRLPVLKNDVSGASGPILPVS